MSKMTYVRSLLLLAVAPAFLLAESKTPSLGFTGAPADHGGQNCSTCHSDHGAANSDTAGSLQVTIDDYAPTIQQTIRIIVQHPQAARWGFQITIREESDETLSSGEFSVVHASDPVQAVCDDGSQFGSAAPCDGTIARQFAEHLNAPRGTGGARFRVRCELDAARVRKWAGCTFMFRRWRPMAMVPRTAIASTRSPKR